MPSQLAITRAKKDKAAGKSASTQAGEFIKVEIDRIRAGKHGARSAKQAIAIGLSEARRAGVKLPIPKKGKVSEKVRRGAILQEAKAKRHEPISRKRSLASTKALKREGKAAASKTALSRHAKAAAKKRTAGERSASARKAVRTRAKK